jgi:hypothetical protein
MGQDHSLSAAKSSRSFSLKQARHQDDGEANESEPDQNLNPFRSCCGLVKQEDREKDTGGEKSDQTEPDQDSFQTPGPLYHVFRATVLAQRNCFLAEAVILRI